MVVFWIYISIMFICISLLFVHWALACLLYSLYFISDVRRNSFLSSINGHFKTNDILFIALQTVQVLAEQSFVACISLDSLTQSAWFPLALDFISGLDLKGTKKKLNLGYGRKAKDRMLRALSLGSLRWPWVALGWDNLESWPFFPFIIHFRWGGGGGVAIPRHLSRWASTNHRAALEGRSANHIYGIYQLMFVNSL